MTPTNHKTLCFILFFVSGFFYNLHAQYCTPTFGDPSQHYISQVEINTINNVSTYVSPTNSYSDFTAQSTDLVIGNTYTMNIHTARVDNWRAAGYGVWIDYNNDNDFDDVDEQIWSFGTSTNNTVSFSFTVPSHATLTNLRLRINMVSWYEPGSCANDTSNFGETEDYTVNILASPDPFASNDELNVIKNSTSGVDNQINVALNDDIGTDGSDGEDYALLSTTTNGTITELSDGVFEYIPNLDFIGNDSFTYQICDANGDCDTAAVYITVDFGACTPTTGSWGTHYITNVLVPGETNTLNYSSGDDAGYGSHLNVTPIVDFYKGNSYTMELSVSNAAATENRSGWVIYIDLNQDGVFNTADEQVWDSYNVPNLANGEDNSLSNTDNTFNPATFTVPTTALSGTTIMRVGTRRYWYPADPCGQIAQPGEFEDYVIDIQLDPASPQDLDVTGNGNFIASGSTITSTDNNTDFGVYDINSGTISRTFIISNNGLLDLNLLPPYAALTGSADFTIITAPALTTLTPGQSTTLTIGFNPSTIGAFSTVVSLYSDDPDENPYTFLVEGEGAQTFPDTDGDGVPDNIDQDDDNDGLTDTLETLSCTAYSNALTTDVVFLNETFGAGTNRIQINGNYPGVTTSYCYEDGTGSCLATYNPTSVNDGDYTVHYTITNDNDIQEGIDIDISDWAEDYWYAGLDHTPGDVNGRMAIFNATEDPGVFYSQEITGATPNVPIQFGFYALNIDRDDIDPTELSTREKPEVVIRIYDPNGVEITSASSGLINPTSPAGDWVEVTASFTTTFSQFTVELSNANLGGLGNDLAIDDIFVKQTLCDLDGDGVADTVDLDNDNDGIPNVVELGLVDDNFDATVYNDTSNPWVDVNGNGVHDAYESVVPIDTDGDGTPDYLDLDSDNDGIFDNVEYDGYGDIDVSGDGLSEGSDYQDATVNNMSDDQDGDGILPQIDDNDDDVDGPTQNDHGTFSYNLPQDSDSDGIPDYLDIDSHDATNDLSNGSDISGTIYQYLDVNNDGVIDGTSDADGDGLLDNFDTSDLIFGSPRDLDGSYSLFFDGRNDYVQDLNILASGSATISAWIKLTGNNTLSNDQVIAGQDNFYATVNLDGTVSLVLNGTVLLSSSVVVTNNIWTHVAITTDASQSVLYVNGEFQASAMSGGITADSSNFTIGKRSSIDNNYFHGEIDEVRVFSTALTSLEVQRTVYQELNESLGFNQGAIIPKDISTNSIGSSLLKYYKMDAYKDDITDNKVTTAIDEINGAKLYNIKQIYFQTAPLPYVTVQDGLWTDTATWQHGNVWDITSVSTNQPWSIVQINNNITTTTSHAHTGLIINTGNTLLVNNDNEISNNWYLELNGTIDLVDESQLVQTNSSDLVTSITGKILRRQEGLSNVYRYNYWGSPIGNAQSTALSDNNIPTNSSNSNFTLDLLKDAALAPIEFTTSYDEIGKLSTYWTHTYQNGVSYFHWNNISITDPVLPGVGYIHKGLGLGGTEFQYVFEGKPNNGVIQISATDIGGAGSIGGVSKTEYLLGNPYPSALDAHQFITDNASVISGEIYLWEQWAGNSHVLALYQGGYATLNLMTSVQAYQFVGLNGSNNGSQDGTKTPTRYLPVAQGFMVEVENSGVLQFNNNQRIFKTETSGESIFFRTNSSQANQVEATQDSIQMIRLLFKTQNNLGREIVLGFSDFTSDQYDYGYDSKAYQINASDLYLPLNDKKMVIQAYAQITPEKIIDLHFIAENAGNYSISKKELVNISNSQEIYLFDTLNNTYHDLTTDTAYTFYSESGTFNDRFKIVFQEQSSLSVDQTEWDNSIIYYSNSDKKLFVKNIDKTVEQITIYNALGQKIFTKYNVNTSQLTSGISIDNQSSGVYIVQLKIESNTLNKKIIIN